MKTVTALSLMAAALLPGVSAHSWIEQMSLMDDKGNFLTNGYPRGYVARTDPGYTGNSMMWMLPSAESKRSRIDNTDFMCHTSQRNPSNTPNYPRLQVTPGSTIAIKYLENGHVTQPLNQKAKQPSGGSVFVFGTTQPDPNAKLMDILKWTADGKGGDGKGVLLAAQNYDDGRCHQLSGSQLSTQRQQQFPDHVKGQPTSQVELWCNTYVTIPKSAPLGQGKYTTYWVWDWRTLPTQQAATEGAGQVPDPGLPNGKDEFYTTCTDFDVVANPPAPAFDQHTLVQQDPMSTAQPGYASKIMGAKVPNPGAEPSPNYGAPGSPQPTSAPAAPPAAAPPTAPTSPAAAPAAPAASHAPAAPAAPASIAPAPSSVSPLGLKNFQPAPSAAPAAAAAPAAPAAPAGGMKVVTVPAGNPVYVIQNGQLSAVQKQKRSEATTLARMPSPIHAHQHAQRHRSIDRQAMKSLELGPGGPE
ncbi:MAG: hypothetical protein Q9162_007273 [Coniocarpon cinnabarinum]